MPTPRVLPWTDPDQGVVMSDMDRLIERLRAALAHDDSAFFDLERLLQERADLLDRTNRKPPAGMRECPHCEDGFYRI